MFKRTILFLSIVSSMPALAADPLEIYCTIRDSGANVSCQQLGRKGSRKTMGAEDISNFVDQGQVAAYVTLKSKKGFERTFLIDPDSPQYKKLGDIKRSASISEISKYKSELFNEIEKKLIRISDDLDNQSTTAELVKWDPSIANDKFKFESRSMVTELAQTRKGQEKFCSTTATFEEMLKTNAVLQSTLSNVLYAFQTPDTCMSDLTVMKDKDGVVDLKQLDTLPQKYRSQCKAVR